MRIAVFLAETCGATRPALASRRVCNIPAVFPHSGRFFQHAHSGFIGSHGNRGTTAPRIWAGRTFLYPVPALAEESVPAGPGLFHVLSETGLAGCSRCAGKDAVDGNSCTGSRFRTGNNHRVRAWDFRATSDGAPAGFSLFDHIVSAIAFVGIGCFAFRRSHALVPAGRHEFPGKPERRLLAVDDRPHPSPHSPGCLPHDPDFRLCGTHPIFGDKKRQRRALMCASPGLAD